MKSFPGVVERLQYYSFGLEMAEMTEWAVAVDECVVVALGAAFSRGGQ